ncbi:hypothetical protein ACFY0P_14350 [Streptomyces sp. NPDC001714]|uniref:hypothetical protein n=1 Tax=Streptomyces sp. NPDC001714 TaxID=3364603 RepID=UPI00368C7B23
MTPDQEREHRRAVIADDVNRLGYLFKAFVEHVNGHPERDAFTLVMAGALAAEFSLADAGAYPPPGHGYPRLDA